MTKNREKVIHIHNYKTETGYFLNEDGKLIYHSFDDEPALDWDGGTKYWYKDDKIHRDNNLPAIIYSDGDCEYYKNDERYWFINNEEEYDVEEIKEKFKNNILELKNVNVTILKENNIDAIWFYDYYYLILDQSQYNLAVLKFI